MKKQIVNLMRTGVLSCLLLILSGFYEVNAQQTITGTVSDESSIPIAGANVLVQGTTTGTVTDFDGNFSIKASSSDVLLVSYLGYVTQNVTIGNQTSLNIILVEDAAQLDEVVVIGYGTAKRSELTESVSQVSAKSFEQQPVVRVEQALQGRSAGVTVARANGSPGAGAKIRIRGVNSITGNNSPLVVLDGFIGGDLRTLNPADIESFQVLKDASATAIYGSRGANGVILVTTKTGKGKPKLSFDTFLSVSELARTYDNRVDAVQFARDNPNFYDNAYIADLIANPVADRESELFRTAFARNHQLSISGGSDNVNYFVSGNYLNQDGIMVANNYERFSLRANVETKINDKLKIGVRTFFNREIDSNNPDATKRIFGGPVVRTLTFDPSFRMFNEDGSYNFEKPLTGNTDATYFVTNLLRSSNVRRANRFNANFNLNYEIVPNLTYTLIAGASITNQTTESLRFESPDDVDNTLARDDQGSVNSNEFSTYQISNILNWNKTFNEKHNIDLTGVYEFTKNENRTNRLFRRSIPTYLRNITDIGRFEVGPGEEQPESIDGDPRVDRRFLEIGAGYGQSAIVSFLARAKYTYNESLSLSASYRRDETTAFLPDNRVGNFMSFSAGYSFKKMAFIENSDVLDNLRLRASWGETGNQNAPRSAFEDTFTVRKIVTPDGTIEIPKQTRRGNPDLTWETTEQANIGLDISFLKSRINLTIDAYEKKTRDLIVTTLVDQNVPDNVITENIGDVKNTGIDVVFDADIIRSDDFTWNTVLAYSFLKNEVVRISDRIDSGFVVGNFRDVGFRQQLNVIKEGEPLGAFWGTKYLGVDANGQAIIDPSGVQVIGNGLPAHTWGLNNTFNYKNWDFNLFVQGSHDFQVYNQVEAALAGGEPNFRSFLKTDKEQVQNSGLNSSRYVEDGDFIRVSNLSIGYTFNNLKGIDFVKVYGSGQNLFLITDYSGYDPEISSSQSNGQANNADVSAGIDAGAIPNPRTFTFGAKIGF
ncbi:SusC/RagA family TonB-linked outer membrane protein [uncultured Algibacter sp.]|uniref:SusC/RagA family TonB-linked outer membrane protein n=1 Tax=uncultured Algibacter sp. TaxID=298659 RepID=UPI002620C492|nr:SusC/RagA family TonB-linked outer membrane protein [uncultured Algibacter sp.]